MMIEKVIDDKEDNPRILKEEVSLTPKVDPVKFDSRGHTEDFVRRHHGKESLCIRICKFLMQYESNARRTYSFP